jgi:Mn2+/Fe2+ NRAMP family transporter
MKNNTTFWVSLIGAIVVAFIIAIWVPGEPDKKVVFAIEYGGLIVTFLFGFMILTAIASGKIDISRLLEEKSADGATSGASMSRFQLLIFTFVIALSLFLIVVNKGAFPDKIPPEVLTLLGISATTYAVGKGIQAGSQSNGSNKHGKSERKD